LQFATKVRDDIAKCHVRDESHRAPFQAETSLCPSASLRWPSLNHQLSALNFFFQPQINAD